MRVITNPGSNLSRAALDRYGVELTPQRIMVDGVEHDTRPGIPHGEIDRWVATAKEFPHVVGTTANEMSQLFAKVGRLDPEILVVTSSRKIIQSHAAALTAARVMSEHPTHKGLRIRVVDSTVTDVGAGLVALAAGEAARASVPLDAAAHALEEMAARVRCAFAVATLDNLVKSGRASFLRAFVASFFDLKPLIGFVDGELSTLAKISGKADPVEAIVGDLAKLGEGRRVWLGVAHGGPTDQAARLLERAKERLDVAYAWLRPLSSSIYLNAGAGSICAAAMPIDGLSWTPPSPPPGLDAD